MRRVIGMTFPLTGVSRCGGQPRVGMSSFPGYFDLTPTTSDIVKYPKSTSTCGSMTNPVRQPARGGAAGSASIRPHFPGSSLTHEVNRRVVYRECAAALFSLCPGDPG